MVLLLYTEKALRWVAPISRLILRMNYTSSARATSPMLWCVSPCYHRQCDHFVQQSGPVMMWRRHMSASVYRSSLVYRLASPGGFFFRCLQRLGFLQIPKVILYRCAYRLYESVVDTIDYQKIYDNCSMPDTFFSWYLVTELHVWMLSVRLMECGAEGELCKRLLLEAMWTDLETRTGKVGSVSSAQRKECASDSNALMKAALIGYDEGLLCDRVLAGVLWRRMFMMQGSDVRRLEKMVAYVRRQLSVLDGTSSDMLLQMGRFKWTTLKAPI